MTVRELVLLRHGPVEVAQGVCYGRTDVAPRGDPRELAIWAQAQIDPEAWVVSSPARRCTALAHALVAQRDACGSQLHPKPDDAQCGLSRAAPCIDPRFAEMHFGAWEMRRYDSIDHDAIALWAADTLGFRPPGGESVGDLCARVHAALDDWTRAAPSLVVVTHGGPMRAALGHLLRWPAQRWTTQQLHFGSLIRLRCEDGYWHFVEHRTAPLSASVGTATVAT